jgi:ABC-type uncharacterized transport system ATPase subunit
MKKQQGLILLDLPTNNLSNVIEDDNQLISILKNTLENNSTIMFITLHSNMKSFNHIT